MKNKLGMMVLWLMVLALAGADTIYVVNSQSRTLSRIDTDTDLVQNSFCILGNVPNKVIVGDNYLYVVNSGDNTIQKIDKSSGNTVATHLVALSSNPWDAVLHEGYLYISGLFSSRVYKMDAETGEVLTSVEVGIAPEALLVADGKLYVTNSGDYTQNYAGSSVSVIDLNSWALLDTIEVGLNPQFLYLQGSKLHVSCTGNWTDLGGSVAVIDIDTDDVIQNIELGATLGNIWIDQHDIAWVADNAGYHLYRYHSEDYTILNGQDDPLAVAASYVAGTSSYLAILEPNWGSNARVYLLDEDLLQLKQYTVGMMPTDLKLQASPSSQEDALLPPVQVSLYPNPLNQGSKLWLKGLNNQSGTYKIYNLKGQLLKQGLVEGDSVQLETQELASACYICQIRTGTKSLSKKFVILK